VTRADPGWRSASSGDLELRNTVILDIPLDAAWRWLTDLDRLILCMPGATGTDDAADDTLAWQFEGHHGIARFSDRDPGRHHGVLQIDQAEPVSTLAVLTIELRGFGEGCEVQVLTAMPRTGNVGPGVVADLHGKLFSRFVAGLDGATAGHPKTPLVPLSAVRTETSIPITPPSVPELDESARPRRVARMTTAIAITITAAVALGRRRDRDRD